MRTGCLLLSHHKQGKGFPDGSVGKDSACNAGDLGLIPGLGRSSGEGNGYLLQYSCLGNPMDREAWWATVHRVINKSETTKHRLYDQEVFSKNYQLSLCLQSENGYLKNLKIICMLDVCKKSRVNQNTCVIVPQLSLTNCIILGLLINL